MEKLRVLLVDDHGVMREGLAALIDAQPDMEVAAQARDGAEALALVEEVLPTIAVVDISMPGMSGPRVIKGLLQAQPELGVIVLSRHGEPGYVRQALEAGARGYVRKQSEVGEVLRATRAVAAGETYLDAELASRLAHRYVGHLGQRNGGPGGELSERERTVVQLVARGYSGKEIATQLQLSVKSVDTYKARAMEKLGLYSRAALVSFALDQAWLEAES
jgi:two-component system, NarL family, response regulator NreC